jgi:hypothetical protein
MDGLVGIVRDLWRSTRRFLTKAGDWVEKWLRRWWKPRAPMERQGVDWLLALHLFYFVLMAVVLVALAILLLHVWKRQKRRPVDAVAEPALPAADLADENVLADQLPSDGWLDRAHELMAAGDLRLALRALYLASLAHLGQRELIVIARFKSNREYERELHRRARTRAELLEAFSQNVSTFESAWYGMHEVTRDILDHFTANFERIRSAS